MTSNQIAVFMCVLVFNGAIHVVFVRNTEKNKPQNKVHKLHVIVVNDSDGVFITEPSLNLTTEWLIVNLFECVDTISLIVLYWSNYIMSKSLSLNLLVLVLFFYYQNDFMD